MTRTNGRLPPVLLVVKDDSTCEAAIGLLRDLGIIFQVTEVSAQDYTPPHEVPKLLTDTGDYVGLDSIERVARREYAEVA